MGIAFLWYLYGEGISLRVWEYFSGILSRAIARNKPSLAVVNHLLLPNTKTFFVSIMFTKSWKGPFSQDEGIFCWFSTLVTIRHYAVQVIVQTHKFSVVWQTIGSFIIVIITMSTYPNSCILRSLHQTLYRGHHQVRGGFRNSSAWRPPLVASTTSIKTSISCPVYSFMRPSFFDNFFNW